MGLVYLKKYIMQNLWSNLLVFTLLFILSLLGVATAVLLTFAVNAIVAGNVYEFIQWAAINLLVWALFLCTNYFTSVYQEKTIQKMCTQIRVDFAIGVEKSEFEQYHSLSSGQYISWMTTDLKTIEDIGFKNVYAYTGGIFSVILSSIALLKYHYILLIATFVLAAMMIFIPNKFTRFIQEATLKLSKSNETLTNKIKNFLEGFDVLYFARKRNKLREKFLTISEDFSKEKVNYAKVNGKMNNGIAFLNIVSQMLIDLITGLLVITKNVTFGAISTTGNLSSTIFNSLAQLSGQRMQIKSAYTIFEKFKEVINANESADHSNETNLEPFETLQLSNLSYSYDNKKVLENLNLTFKRGGKYAIVGESGTGKSTLLKIIAGQIQNFDGQYTINGVKQHKINRDDFQYIDQNVYLFEDTFRNNLTLWDDYTDEAITLSIKKAHINFIEDIDFIIEENGRNLSGGQKQRIALARSFIQNKKMVLIDEGTSALDKQSAQYIEQALLNDPLLTVIMVTHRLDPESIQLFDEVIDLTPVQNLKMSKQKNDLLHVKKTNYNIVIPSS